MKWTRKRTTVDGRYWITRSGPFSWRLFDLERGPLGDYRSVGAARDAAEELDVPADVVRAFPDHLRGSVRPCKRCRNPFAPLEAGRDRCAACIRSDRADVNLIRMAYGEDWR